MSSHSKPQSHCHPRRVTLDRCINIFLHTGKVDNLIQLASDFVFRHAHNSTIHINILASGQIRMKTCSHFQQRSDTPLRPDTSRCGGSDTRQYFQQSRLARPILANDTQHLSSLYLKINIFQSPHKISHRFLRTIVHLADTQIRVFLSTYPCPPAIQVTAQCARTDRAQGVLFTHIIKFNCYITHTTYCQITSIKLRCTLLKVIIPHTTIRTVKRKLYPKYHQLKIPSPKNPYLNVSIMEVNGLAIINHIYFS